MRIRVADPAGNITIFVMDKAQRKDYAAISKQLLTMEEFHAEQVGFVEEKEDGSVHMQMMGGEFCGNASRSFAYLMSMLSEDKPSKMLVDVSGADHLLEAEVDLEHGCSRIQMPLPLEIRELDLGEDGKYPMVVFEGICHMISESAPKDDAFVDRAIHEAEKVYPCDAYGVMFLEENKMTPVVYVKETKSLVWESSCGSGSTGTAVYLSHNLGDGEHTFDLCQPGGVLQVSVYKSQGKITQCKMGGTVTISEEIVVHTD